jgi:murein DD-endopeptidase MepM/ murein hydrolase activator NlpD
MNRRAFLIFLALSLAPALAFGAKAGTKSAPEAKIVAALDCPGEAGVGEPFVLRLRLAGAVASVASAQVEFLGRTAPLELRREGDALLAEAVLGTDVLADRPGQRQVTVRVARTSGRVLRLAASLRVVPVERPTESLVLDPSMVDPPASELPRIAAERARSHALLARATPRRLAALPFLRPVPGEVSSIYGIGRVLNGRPKAPHRGLDLEAATGDSVVAAADGVVVLTGSFYYAGNCVYLDHGQGLHTMYFHLSEIRVKPGRRVARGELLGLAGATGRSTRPHLHFGISSLGRLVDPEPLFLYDGFHNGRSTPPE